MNLRGLERCFRGTVPAVVATCSPEGIPNITYLSIVHLVDDEHVALSFQFFNKTRDNILAHPHAELLVPDPATMQQYRLDIAFLRTETEGPVFERMRTNLDAIASQTGMGTVFRLRGADVYRVVAVEELAHDLDLAAPEGSPDFLAALEGLSTELAACDELEELLQKTLTGLAERFDYHHATILFADDSASRLYTVASHGFADSGIGAELAFGQGVVGAAAREQKPVRIENFFGAQVMADAVLTTASEGGRPAEPAREIALPALPNVQSQLAVPLLARDRTMGVISVMSTEPGRFTTDDEHALGTLARYLATSILLLERGRSESSVEHGAPSPRSTPATATVRHHASDDSIFIDETYLIKGLSGRILLRLLTAFERGGRIDFTNKELRLDTTLDFGGGRDNLDARLILLRQRLEGRTDALRLVKTGRGRLRLEVLRPIELVRAP